METDKEFAEKIATTDFLSNNINKPRHFYHDLYVGAMQMAEWKNEKFDEILEGWYDWAKENCRSNVSFTDMSNFVRFMRESWDKTTVGTKDVMK